MSANQPIESSQSNGVDRFVNFVEIPSLQEIASHQVALAIRYNDQSRRFFDPTPFTYLPGTFSQKYDSEVESLPTPSAIKELIRNSLEKIENEVPFWLQHFNHVLYGLSRRPYKVNPVDINWCVWLPNGEIDYLKTGMKMLESEKLSELQKFLIMCEYCMEDEIKKVSLDTLPADYIESTDYYDDGILFYWIHFLNNRLHEIPLENYASPEAAMARSFQRYSRFPVEYFWHRIGEEDQLIVVSEWIENRFRSHFECASLERLISDMSLAQQQRLLAKKPIQMLINFTLFSHSTRCALWAWKYCKEAMPEEQFARIIEIILRRWTHEGHPCPALFEIWETAYDHQRNFVLQTKASTIIDMCLFRYNTYGNALQFVITFLRQISLEDRKKTIFDQARNVKHLPFDLSCLNEILNVCLPRPNDRLEFIKSVVDSEGMKVNFFNFIRAREFKKLDALMGDFFGHNIDEARAYQIKLLESMKFEESCGIAFISNVDEWKIFGDYIDEIFSNDPAQALKEKQRLIKLMILSKQFRYLFDLRRDLQETMKVVELVFANEDLKNIKRIFASSFGESLKSRSYWEHEVVSDETYFRRIIDWCLGTDEEAILEFKKRVSKDTIFDRVFVRMNEFYRERGGNDGNLEALLDRLNKYLKWYLASDDEVNIFKLSRLSSSFQKLKIFRSISNRMDGEYLEILLKWFFGDDGEQMGKFRSEHFRF